MRRTLINTAQAASKPSITKVRCSRTRYAAHVQGTLLTYKVRCSRKRYAAHVQGTLLTYKVRCSRTRYAAHVQGTLLTYKVRCSALICRTLDLSDPGDSVYGYGEKFKKIPTKFGL